MIDNDWIGLTVTPNLARHFRRSLVTGLWIDPVDGHTWIEYRGNAIQVREAYSVVRSFLEIDELRK